MVSTFSHISASVTGCLIGGLQVISSFASRALFSSICRIVPTPNSHDHGVSLISVHSSSFINRFETFPGWLDVFYSRKPRLRLEEGMAEPKMSRSLVMPGPPAHQAGSISLGTLMPEEGLQRGWRVPRLCQLGNLLHETFLPRGQGTPVSWSHHPEVNE